jgi:hypothetical protein
MDGAAHSEFLRRSRSMLASDIGSHRSDIGFVISLPFAVRWDLPGTTYPMPSDQTQNEPVQAIRRVYFPVTAPIAAC